jgi:hypothetical protein
MLRKAFRRAWQCFGYRVSRKFSSNRRTNAKRPFCDPGHFTRS